MGSNKAINGTTLGKKNLVYSSSVTLRFPWSVTGGGGGIKFRTQNRQCVGATTDKMLVNT